MIFAAEQGTAYCELIDPLDQRERLVSQSLLAAAGDPEAMQVDEDFLEALEYGMPPTGGMGMGIDRLVMNLTGLGIRDTIFFPLRVARTVTTSGRSRVTHEHGVDDLQKVSSSRSPAWSSARWSGGGVFTLPQSFGRRPASSARSSHGRSPAPAC